LFKAKQSSFDFMGSFITNKPIFG